MNERTASDDRPAQVFIGSSSEGAEYAEHLQVLLDKKGCEARTWTQGVFRPSGYTLESLIKEAGRSDFAVLIATADDTTVKKADTAEGHTADTPRDNVIFELGLFVGAIGRERTFIVVDKSARPQLPTDLAGVTWCGYTERSDGNVDAALTGAVLEIAREIKEQGVRRELTDAMRPSSGSQPSGDARPPAPATLAQPSKLTALEYEIHRIWSSAYIQGWTYKLTPTTLRLTGPKKQQLSLNISGPSNLARAELRKFAARLRANGLRVPHDVRGDVEPEETVVQRAESSRQHDSTLFRQWLTACPPSDGLRSVLHEFDGYSWPSQLPEWLDDFQIAWCSHTYEDAALALTMERLLLSVAQLQRWILQHGDISQAAGGDLMFNWQARNPRVNDDGVSAGMELAAKIVSRAAALDVLGNERHL